MAAGEGGEADTAASMAASTATMQVGFIGSKMEDRDKERES